MLTQPHPNLSPTYMSLTAFKAALFRELPGPEQK